MGDNKEANIKAVNTEELKEPTEVEKEQNNTENGKFWGEILELKERIQACSELTEIQRKEARSVIDKYNYMVGMYNGMELLLSILENRTPNLYTLNINTNEQEKPGYEQNTTSEDYSTNRTINGNKRVIT